MVNKLGSAATEIQSYSKLCPLHRLKTCSIFKQERTVKLIEETELELRLINLQKVVLVK
jgi:hypothetical protein